MLTIERFNAHLVKVRAKIEGKIASGELTSSEEYKLNEGLAIDFEEHFQFQTAQALAYLQEKISAEVAKVIYNALGETCSASNGGWAKNVDLALKVTITQFMAELLAMRIKAA